MDFKGYEAALEYDDDAHVFHGEVMHLRDVIPFQGGDLVELQSAFHDSVDDYLRFCLEQGKEPASTD